MPAGLTDTIVEWESNGLPNETIRLPVTENHSFSPKIVSVNNSRDFTLKVCLFVTVKLTKNADPDKYSYPGYGIIYDACSLFSFPKFDWDKMLLFLE